MTEFYTVSFIEFSENQKIELITETNELSFFGARGLYSESDTKKTLNDLFPKGISKHGMRYLSEKFDFANTNGKDYVPNIPLIESTFEYIRRINHIEKPSRFQSFFGCETLKQAEFYNRNYRQNKGGIYKVCAEKHFKADMNLLKIGFSILGNTVLAEKYWNQESSENPFWEILMTGKIIIKEKIL